MSDNIMPENVRSVFVGNLPYDSTDEFVTKLFEPFGTVHSVHLVGDRVTGRFRGFAFVRFVGQVNEAVNALDGRPAGTQRLIVNEIDTEALTGEAV